MRVLVLGAGGVGGHYGGMLACAGHDVTFVARGAHLAAMQAHGLELRTGKAQQHLQPVHAIAAPIEKSEPDLVLFTVKTYDTAAAIEALGPALGSRSAVLTFQNGVESTQLLADAFGAARVLVGATVMTSVVVAPGKIETAPIRRLVLAELAGPPTQRLERIAAAFGETGVEVSLVADAQQAIWEKFVLLVALSTVTTACDLPIGPIRESQEGANLLREVMHEVCNVGHALGVRLGDDVIEASMHKILAAPGTAKSSMQLDYEGKRRVELEQLAGAAVRLGHELGVPTPKLDALYPVLKLRAESFGGLTYTPQQGESERVVT
jgi:2-dehydropantoate 2-reductase